jgi:hypothetical protein
LADPDGQDPGQVRAICAEIEQQTVSLSEELNTAA